jgi:hypothetical protein
VWTVDRAPLSLRALDAHGAECTALTIESDETFEPDRVDVTLRVTCSEDVEAGVRVELPLEPTDDPAWLIPGVFYGENRPANSTRTYPRFVRGRVDIAAMESDAWSFRADRCATPAVFSGDVGLATTELSAVGQTGVGFADDDGRPVLHLDFPFREEPFRYDGTETPAPPDVRVHRWEAGETVELGFSVYHGGYAQALRDVHARASRRDAAWVSVEEAAELAAWGLFRWHFREDPARLIETATFDGEGERDAMHVSWVSGAPYAYALLRHGRRVDNAEYVGAAEAVLDHIAANLTPGGTFWAQWTAERGWTTGWHRDRSRLHARTLADATLFMLRAGGSWDAAARSNVEVAARTQRSDGALPAAHHVETGEAVSWDGTAGMSWIPALVAAGRLDEARRAGEFYKAFDLYNGAPEDVDLAPTSEDGYAAVMAYVSLEDWEAARRAADWMLTFRYTYDVDFPAGTPLAEHRFSTFGADTASPVNPHLHAFGLICHPELVQLARALGDSYYSDRAREHLQCFRQFVARSDGDFGARRGMATERYYQTDYVGPKGTLLPLSHAWSVGVLLYACEAELELDAVS